MAAEWYYTTNKQQMGPVSWDELQQLAGKGLLKPNDLVWTEGMAEWVKANRQEGLFTETEVTASRGGAAAEEAPPPPRKSATRRRIDDELDEHDDDGRRERRKRRASGSGTGLKIGLAIGGVVLIVLFLACGIGGAVALFMIDWGGSAPNYNISLAPGTQNQRNFTWRGGQRVQIIVTTDRNPGIFQPDVDLYILRRGNIIAADTRISPDCNLTILVPGNDTYTVRVVNLGPGRANSHVNVHAQ